jgi:putative MFS transporter
MGPRPVGFAGVFGLTTLVLAAGVASILAFGLSTTGHSLEELSEDAVPAPAVVRMVGSSAGG